MEIAKHRNDELGRNVLWNIGEEIDLPVRDAQYHERCYHSFKTIPKFVDLITTSVVGDDALKSCINVMFANQSKLYNTTDLYDMYLDYGDKFSHKQIFAKLNKTWLMIYLSFVVMDVPHLSDSRSLLVRW